MLYESDLIIGWQYVKREGVDEIDPIRDKMQEQSHPDLKILVQNRLGVQEQQGSQQQHQPVGDAEEVWKLMKKSRGNNEVIRVC